MNGKVEIRLLSFIPLVGLVFFFGFVSCEQLRAQNETANRNCKQIETAEDPQDLAIHDFEAFTALAPKEAVFEVVQGIHYPYYRFVDGLFEITFCFNSGCRDISDQERKMSNFVESIESIKGLNVRIYSWQNDSRNTLYLYQFGATYFFTSKPSSILTVHVASSDLGKGEMIERILRSVLIKESSERIKDNN